MKIKKGTIWIGIVVLLALIGSFYIGGVIGFNEGTGAMEYLHGADAYYTVSILKRIREGKDDRAIFLLEGKLDRQLFDLGHFDSYKTSIFYPASYHLMKKDGKNLYGLMKKVAEYRKKYPSRVQQGPGTRVIRETLKKYGQQ